MNFGGPTWNFAHMCDYICMFEGTQMGEALGRNKVFAVMVLLVVLYFLIPFLAKIDRFPFSNYPMYATAPYRSPVQIFLCGPDQQRLGRFLYPVHPRMAAYLSRKVARDAGVRPFESAYIKALEEKFRRLENLESAKLYFVRYNLDFESYGRAVLDEDRRAELKKELEFDPCVNR